MVETGRSQSRGKNIDPGLNNSPYLSSPIRPVPSTSGKSRTPGSKKQSQPNNSQDGLAPLRDITVSSKSPTSLLKSTSRSRSAGRQRLLRRDDVDDNASLADSTICTTRTTARPSPYLMGAGGSTSARRTGQDATTSPKKPPKLLLMPDEVDELLLEFKQRQHEEGKLLLLNNNMTDNDDDGEDDADEEYSSDEEDESDASDSSSEGKDCSKDNTCDFDSFLLNAKGAAGDLLQHRPDLVSSHRRLPMLLPQLSIDHPILLDQPPDHGQLLLPAPAHPGQIVDQVLHLPALVQYLRRQPLGRPDVALELDPGQDAEVLLVALRRPAPRPLDHLEGVRFLVVVGHQKVVVVGIIALAVALALAVAAAVGGGGDGTGGALVVPAADQGLGRRGVADAAQGLEERQGQAVDGVLHRVTGSILAGGAGGAGACDVGTAAVVPLAAAGDDAGGSV
eukprot:CAMPEP_0181063236 /NCGR_PEP_ID=MMETSP1070-20121207/23529_1 /TAXON_ID=265543 /ORGANISM="Minutocellus polymorphus, Strain NH13" /LENGTH=449 /DNA_ID=CAMNT_0023143409 /DNA_START=45 /DNA_END=1393 /DNA_ORIENTATION=-